ncbi:hypothetical protein BKA70DRAFT_1313191 [Coprinopsis sp. MPI-PUGE-AT-0042]|nr:hypothetical protein BKA70DRAFT_1313191 [Coprinopsis sp. MPI-PUGE-AT-0042]
MYCSRPCLRLNPRMAPSRRCWIGGILRLSATFAVVVAEASGCRSLSSSFKVRESVHDGLRLVRGRLVNGSLGHR